MEASPVTSSRHARYQAARLAIARSPCGELQPTAGASVRGRGEVSPAG
jgi:hypothetical protein